MDDDVAVVSIQRRFRGYHTRIIAQYKSNNAAVTIQRAYREWKYKSTALPADKGYDGDNYAAYAVIDYTGTFTAQDHLIGPFRRRIGAGQMRTERVNHGAFLIDNPLREVAIQKPSEIDAMNTDLGDSFVWLDDTITKLVVFDDYAAIRAAVAKPPGNNWSEVLRVMQKYDDRVLVQVYGLRCFSKGVIPMDPLCGMVSHTARQALDVIETVIRNATKQYALTHIYFALEALQNFLAVRPGRAEFLSTTHITAVGLLRQTAVSNHYKHQLDMLFQYLIYIPTEEIIMPIILEDEPNSIITPTSRACDVVAMVIECLGCLCRDPSSQELVAEISTPLVLKAMMTCCEDPTVMLTGLRLLYAATYRNESGYGILTDSEVLTHVLDKARDNFSGDKMITQQLWRVEESLRPDGWRGLLEK